MARTGDEALQSFLNGTYDSFEGLTELPYATLFQLHHGLWGLGLNTVTDHAGDLTCDSMGTLVAMALRAPEIDSHQTLADFPELRLEPRWVHEELMGIPVTCYDMQSAVDLLQALDWAAFGDHFAPKDGDWLVQLRGCFSLVESRILFFIRREAWSSGVLNMDHYTDRCTRGEALPPPREYDSDGDELPLPPPSAMDEEKKKKATPAYSVNTAFVYDMDSLLSNFHVMMRRCLLPGVKVKVNTGPFREWIFKEAKGVGDDYAVKSRRTHQEGLSIHEGHKRVYARMFPLSSKPKLRQIMIQKNEDLLPRFCSCTSFSEIVNDAERDVPVMRRFSMDSMLLVVGRAAVEALDIEHNPLWNLWVLELGGQRLHFTSLTAAFMYKRRDMVRRGASPTIREVDTSVLDAHFLLPQ